MLSTFECWIRKLRASPVNPTVRRMLGYLEQADIETDEARTADGLLASHWGSSLGLREATGWIHGAV